MKYRVLIQRQAERDLNACYLWAARHAPETAARWHDRFQTEILSLANYPTRCGLAAESGMHNREIRQLLFGRRPNVFRALFTIDGDSVRVMRIIRASRRPLTKREIEEADD
jgi:plasmid stabilization system protein ParE